MERPKNKTKIAMHQDRKHGTAYQIQLKLTLMYRYETCGTLVYNCTQKHTQTIPTEQAIVNPYVVFFIKGKGSFIVDDYIHKLTFTLLIFDR